MTRTACSTFEFSLLQGEKICKFSDDQISGLPDEILVFILSRLTVKEAARTSFLGRRWEHLWKFISVLDLDDEKLNDLPNREMKRPAYSRWVTQALKSHHASTIEEFKIRFDLIRTSANDIDNWVEFAFQKRVQILELDFSSWRGGNQDADVRYALKKQPLGLGGFNRLSTLRMKEVNATDDVFEYLFACSPLLQKLSVDHSSEVVNLKINGPSINLKYLEIVACPRLKSMEIISALHLVSFKYSGSSKISMLFKNVPKLAEVNFCGHFVNRLRHLADSLSSYLPQLKKLDLNFTREALLCRPFQRRRVEELPRLPVLSNLRHLTLVVQVVNAVTLLRPVMFMLDACPLLHRFTLVLQWIYYSKAREEPKDTTTRSFPSLKVVELLGFVGDRTEMELGMCLLESAVSLEKLVIKIDLWRTRNSPEEQQLTRECAMKLGAKIPSTAEFILEEEP